MYTLQSDKISEFLNNSKIKYALLFLIIIFLYGRTIFFEFNLDDKIITDAISEKINTVNDLFSIFKLSYNNTDYRPVVLFSFGIENLIFGSLQPSISHFINIILFFLITLAALQLFKALFDPNKNSLIFVAIVLFCVLPVNSEVVCSIKCRDNLLSMLFGLYSSLFFIRFLEKERLNYLFLLISVLFTFLGILSKMDAIGFVFFNLFYYIYYYKKDWKAILYYSLCIIITTNIVNKLSQNALFTEENSKYIGLTTFTENPLSTSNLIGFKLIAFANTIYYYFTRLAPISDFRYYYGYNYLKVLSTDTISFYCGLVILILFILLLIRFIINNNKVGVIGILGLFLTSIYALNLFIPVAGIIADRYIFIASLFFCLLLSYFLFKISNFLKKEIYLLSMILTILLFFIVTTSIRVGAWKNIYTLIKTDAPKLTNSYEAMRIASSVYMSEYEKTDKEEVKQELQQKCIYYAEKGIEVYPKNYLLHQFLGQYYFKFNKPDKSLEHLHISLKNDSSKTSYFYLGDIHYSIKNLDSALYYYKAALKKNPSSPVLINNISTVYFEMGDKEKCLQFNYDLLKNDSSIFAAYENLGYYYLAEKDTAKAESYFKQGEKYGLPPVKIRYNN
jgi:tetratricopeptide (TPR) repeat protein